MTTARHLLLPIILGLWLTWIGTSEDLPLCQNALETYPADLINLPVLKLIDLHANPMRPHIPMELQQRGVLVRF